MKIKKYLKKKIEEFSEIRAIKISDDYGFSNHLEVKKAFIEAATLCLRFNLIYKRHKSYVFKIIDYYCKDTLTKMLDKTKYEYQFDLRLSMQSIMRDTFYEYLNHNFFNSFNCFCKRVKRCFNKYFGFLILVSSPYMKVYHISY
jgi:hypothetical protein